METKNTFLLFHLPYFYLSFSIFSNSEENVKEQCMFFGWLQINPWNTTILISDTTSFNRLNINTIRYEEKIQQSTVNGSICLRRASLVPHTIIVIMDPKLTFLNCIVIEWSRRDEAAAKCRSVYSTNGQSSRIVLPCVIGDHLI